MFNCFSFIIVNDPREGRSYTQLSQPLLKLLNTHTPTSETALRAIMFHQEKIKGVDPLL